MKLVIVWCDLNSNVGLWYYICWFAKEIIDVTLKFSMDAVRKNALVMVRIYDRNCSKKYYLVWIKRLSRFHRIVIRLIL